MSADDMIVHPGAPTVTHVICNAVMVCSCVGKTLLVLNVLGGEIQCPSCQRKWYSPELTYTLDRVTKLIKISCVTDEVPRVDVFDGLSMANLRLLPGKKQ